MKKKISLFLISILMMMCAACGNAQEEAQQATPQVSQMKSICELAVMDCYYHNVAKYTQEDAAGILWWKKDKHFWIEYSGIVKLGIDASLVNMEVKGDQIAITLPEAAVVGCKIDSASLTEDSYIVDKKSADVKAEDESFALEEAQRKLEEAASNDKALLLEAQMRAQSLLEDYVQNIGNAVGKQYSIEWIYVDREGKEIEKPSAVLNADTEQDPS